MKTIEVSDDVWDAFEAKWQAARAAGAVDTSLLEEIELALESDTDALAAALDRHLKESAPAA